MQTVCGRTKRAVYDKLEKWQFREITLNRRPNNLTGDVMTKVTSTLTKNKRMEFYVVVGPAWDRQDNFPVKNN